MRTGIFWKKLIDSIFVFSKQNGKDLTVKGICAASLKQKDRWSFTVIQKSTGNNEFATISAQL